MMDVSVHGGPAEIEALAAFGNEAQQRFRFVAARAPGAVALYVVPRLARTLFSADRQRGVLVSAAESAGISFYLGMPRIQYLFLCSLLGLTHWRALDLNPLLIPEDLFHAEPPECLFAAQETVQHYALRFERPHICPACRDFFHCLGVESELTLLQTLLPNGHEPRTAFSCDAARTASVPLPRAR